MKTLAVVIPTIRPEKYKQMLQAWKFGPDTELVTIWDGEKPILEHAGNKYTVEDIMGKDSDLIFNFNAGVRNLGFAYVAKKLPMVEYIVTLDDDLLPHNNTLEDHVNVLNMKGPISWMMVGNAFTRGFPYGVRSEAEIVLSHGVWKGVPDYDAPTQLVRGTSEMEFYVGVVPKGVLFPMSGMNLAFRRKVIPYVYFAPTGGKWGMSRFDDIWMGINCKKELDKRGWGVVTGFASVYHNRASNVFDNLIKEAEGIKFNEEYWKGEIDHPYFKMYEKNRKRWEAFING